MVIAQGDVWWADLPEPSGSGPGYRRPVVVVQSDAFNRSTLRTVVCILLTSNRKWASTPGNIALSEHDTGLAKRSVANVTQIIALDRETLAGSVGRLPSPKLELILAGIDLVLGRW